MLAFVWRVWSGQDPNPLFTALELIDVLVQLKEREKAKEERQCQSNGGNIFVVAGECIPTLALEEMDEALSA